MAKKRQFFDEEAACEDDFEDDEDENDPEEIDEDEQNDMSDFRQEDGEALENSDDNDDDEEEVQRSASKENNRNRLQKNSLINKSAAKKAKRLEATKQKLPGDTTLPINSFSLTISKTKDDIAPTLLKVIFEEFILKYCVKGGVATEVGCRVGNCHLQSVIQLHCLKTAVALKQLSKS